MPTFTELHEQHPTPWSLGHVIGSLTWRVRDANGTHVNDDVVVAMMNAAANEIERPEAVEACVEAVRAESSWRDHQEDKHTPHGAWSEIDEVLSTKMTDTMDYAVMELSLKAIAALPEDG